MRLSRHPLALAALLASCVLPLVTGCLNLGGKTTHVHDNPETQSRIGKLETRVKALEQSINGPATASPGEAYGAE
jgi:hypothetical protein